MRLNYWLGHIYVCINVWIKVVCHAVSVAATHACIRFLIWEIPLISWFSCPIGIGKPNLNIITRHWQDGSQIMLTQVRLIIKGLYCSTHRADWRLRSSFRSSCVPRTYQGNNMYVVYTCTLRVCVFLVCAFFFHFLSVFMSLCSNSLCTCLLSVLPLSLSLERERERWWVHIAHLRAILDKPHNMSSSCSDSGPSTSYPHRGLQPWVTWGKESRNAFPPRISYRHTVTRHRGRTTGSLTKPTGSGTVFTTSILKDPLRRIN